MRVLIVALGAARRTAARAEAEAVRAAGGEASLFTHEPGAWTHELAAAGFPVHFRRELLWAGHWPQWIARLLVWRIPLFLLHRPAVGPLRAPLRRLGRAYQRRIAFPVQRRLVDRVHRRLWPAAAARLFAAHVAAGGYDAIIAADPHAILLLHDAVRADAAARRRARIAYSFDHLAVRGDA
ncbi:hypothetical protein GCM10010123_29600 [Pilimelia anulata]|uniref:Uncharacterized protein n=1 Tax=Pilimelia anulata TaxID=53371 RepID=A0A8J3BE76_9ACTN|nr:hypothetical protein [Pilimelia anulata]GGJ97672.1 hypothetical protein GCM10010123_29600 [Pilimelia anulata]